MKDTTFRAVSTILAIGLAVSLFPSKSNERVKLKFHNLVIVLWLLYAVYYNDYIVGIVCGLILVLDFSKLHV